MFSLTAATYGAATSSKTSEESAAQYIGDMHATQQDTKPQNSSFSRRLVGAYEISKACWSYSTKRVHTSAALTILDASTLPRRFAERASQQQKASTKRIELENRSW